MNRRALAIVLAIFVVALPVLAITTGWKDPSTTALGTNWTGTGNGYASDDSRAAYAAATQDVWCLQGFGFTGTDIPSGSTIDGITVTVEGQASSTTAANRSILVSVTKASGCAIAGAEEAAQNLNRNADTTLTFGGSTSLWGTTWTDTDIVSNANFGVRIRVGNTNTSSRSIDHVRVLVTYTLAGGGGRTRRFIS